MHQRGWKIKSRSLALLSTHPPIGDPYGSLITFISSNVLGELLGLAFAWISRANSNHGYQTILDWRMGKRLKATSFERTWTPSRTSMSLGSRTPTIIPSQRHVRDLGLLLGHWEQSLPSGLSGQRKRPKGLVSGPAMCPTREILSLKLKRTCSRWTGCFVAPKSVISMLKKNHTHFFMVVFSLFHGRRRRERDWGESEVNQGQGEG